MGLDIGALRYKVAIKKKVNTRDALGQTTQTLEDVATVWADIRFLRGFEAIKAGAQTSTKSCSIRIRWRTDITEGMEAWHAGVKYNINAVLPDMLKRERIDLMCEVQ